MTFDLSFAPHLRGHGDGRYGELMIFDDAVVRSLCCGPNCNGSAYLEPATMVAGEAFSPGAVPEASYHLGWLIAALARPDGHLLMAGLGAGVGVSLLLDQFPRLQVTVAEIDPAVVRLAREYFPLLGAYERTGRATVLTDDISEVVKRGGGWSTALLDAYQHDTIAHCPPALLSGLHGNAESVWVNLVDAEDQLRVAQCATDLAAAGWSASTVVPIVMSHRGIEYPTGNHLLGTASPDVAAVNAFVPFAGIAHVHAEEARQTFAAIARQIHAWPDRPVPDANLGADAKSGNVRDRLFPWS